LLSESLSGDRATPISCGGLTYSHVTEEAVKELDARRVDRVLKQGSVDWDRIQNVRGYAQGAIAQVYWSCIR
jgi:hypothetical protein